MGEDRRILDRHRRALGKERRHGVGGVAEQGDWVDRIRAAGIDRGDRPAPPLGAEIDHAPARRPAIRRSGRRAVAGRRARSSPRRASLLDDGDDVDLRADGDRVVDEVGVLAPSHRPTRSAPCSFAAGTTARQATRPEGRAAWPPSAARPADERRRP